MLGRDRSLRPGPHGGTMSMRRLQCFLTCAALAAWPSPCRTRRCARSRFSAAERRRSRLRHRDRSGRPARHDPRREQLRGARRRQAAADHAVRQHAPADPADRDAGRVGQHGGQPAAAARRSGPALRAAAPGRRRARRHVRTRDHHQSVVHARCRGAAAALPDTIEPDAPTPLWRAIDEAIDAFGEKAESGAR